MRILITGSREWVDRETIRKAMADFLEPYCANGGTPAGVEVIQGKARGADTIAAEIAEGWGCQGRGFKADWKKYGKAAGHRRNAEMVATKPDVVLAFPIGLSPGTRGYIELARRAGIPVRIYEGPTT